MNHYYPRNHKKAEPETLARFLGAKDRQDGVLVVFAATFWQPFGQRSRIL
jgi:hypothetical protein